MRSALALPVVVRRALVKHPWIHWIIVAVAATACVAAVVARVDRIDAARDAWGETRRVLVARRATSPGEPLVVVSRDLPVAVVPPAAIGTGVDVAGLVARQHIGAGEIVTTDDVGRLGQAAPAALVPDGWLAVPIVESPASGAEVGARVQIVSDGVVLAPDGRVVGYHDDVTLVAVPADRAPAVPAAAAASGVALLLVP